MHIILKDDPILNILNLYFSHFKYIIVVYTLKEMY